MWLAWVEVRVKFGVRVRVRVRAVARVTVLFGNAYIIVFVVVNSTNVHLFFNFVWIR